MFFHTQMSFQLCVGQREHQTLIHPFRRNRVKAHADGNTVSRLEADSHHLTQAVGVVPNDVHGLLSVLLVQFDCAVRRYAMRRQKSDHIACAPGSHVRVTDFFEFGFADARYGEQLLRIVIQYSQRILPEHGINLFRNFRTDALDLPGTQVSNDAFPVWGDHLVKTLNLKLDAMFGIPAPAPAHVIAKIIRRRQAVAHRLDFRNRISRRIQNLLAGAVQGDHVACAIGGHCFGIDQLFELAYQDRILLSL